MGLNLADDQRTSARSFLVSWMVSARRLVIRAAQLGLKTVVVESDRLGGECVNYGCIPSKSLITVAKLVDKV